MIEFLRGTLLRKANGHILVDVNGVGYGLDVAESILPSLPDIGQPVELLVYFHVQVSQGAASGFHLYGFLEERDRELFEVLISAQGIGPSKAIDIMSTIGSEDLARAVLRGDVAQLGRLKGIGKKTAEKLIVVLREKMKRYALAHVGPEPAAAQGSVSGGAAGRRKPVPAGAATGAGAVREAVEALESLGVKPLIAERAVQKALEVLGAEASLPDLIKEGLKHRK